jgi:hypothetical protein
MSTLILPGAGVSGVLPRAQTSKPLSLAGARVSGSFYYFWGPDNNYFDATAPGSSVPPGLGNSAPHSPTNVLVVDGTTTFGYLNPTPIPGQQRAPGHKEVLGHALFTCDLTTSGVVTLEMNISPSEGSYPYADYMGSYIVRLDCSSFDAPIDYRVLADSFSPLGVDVKPEKRDGSLWFYVPPWDATAVVSGPLTYSIELLSADSSDAGLQCPFQMCGGKES